MTPADFRAMLTAAGVTYKPRPSTRYLSRVEFGARIGVTKNTIDSYAGKGMLPPPDAVTGTTAGWLPATIDAWQQARPRAK